MIDDELAFMLRLQAQRDITTSRLWGTRRRFDLFKGYRPRILTPTREWYDRNMETYKDLAQRVAWRAADGFLTAVVFDNIFGIGLSEWKVAVAAGASAGIKPLVAFVSKKAGRG
jgi:hypothetical protein